MTRRPAYIDHITPQSARERIAAYTEVDDARMRERREKAWAIDSHGKAEGSHSPRGGRPRGLGKWKQFYLNKM